MNQKNMLNILKQKGFTAFELIGVLVIVAFLIMTTNKIANNIRMTKEYNQLADQSNNFSKIASKYIEDNYRILVNQAESGNDVVISYSTISSHIPANLSAFTKRNQVPCIYITSDSNNRLMSSIRAYLIFGEISSSGGAFSQQDATNIVHTIGVNAGILVHNNGLYTFKGGVENDLTFSASTANNIITGCGFINPLPQNSLIVDLSKNNALFASMRGNIDQQSSKNDPDPSLKKSQLTNMQTNIYLDNIYKESSSITSYYCDAAQLPPSGASTLCQNFANANGISMYPNTSTWSSSIQSGSSCLATATAHFYTISTSYSCNGVNMGNPASYCPATLGNKNIVSGSGFWSPNPPQLSGNLCVSKAYAYYATQGVCDGDAWWMDANNSISRGDKDSPPNWQRAVTGGQFGEGAQRFISCAVKQPDDHHTMVHCPGTYNQSTKMCDIGLRYWMNPVIYTSFAPTGGGQQDSTATYCGQNVVNAAPSQSTIDLGIMSCGSTTYPLLTSVTGIPAQHVYRALDYGNSSISGQRIQIKSDAPAGATVTSSKLAVNHAGLQSGLIAPVSHLIIAGSSCNSIELGKILQDMSSITINSQIQCSYNPTFCSGAGYCFLPIKSTTFDYQFSTPKASSKCPVGTVVDGNQPAQNISTSVSCPNIQGWNLTQSVHGEGIPDSCYKGITGMNFCQGYQTVCTYQQGKQLVSALTKLRCTNSTSAYTVDNYIP
jgi:hypothetical protein